jgi:glycosyltransferase involved in cell wall biosynthesis
MNRLDRDKFAPELIAVRGEGPLRQMVAPDIPVHVLGNKGVIKSIPALLLALHRIWPDVAVSTMALTNFALLALKPFLGRTRLIVREAVTPSYILGKHPFAAPFIRCAYRLLYAQAEAVVSPAPIIVNEFERDLHMNVRRHIVIPNPVDTSIVHGETLEDDGAETVRFLCAGRLLPQKGFDRLIAATDKMPHGDWRLTILGEGPQRAELEKMIHTPNIALPGHSARPWPLMAAADAFLLPSRSEGLPNVALEALACGTKVIAMKEAGGISEIAREAPPGAVQIARTMDEFIAMMSRVKREAGPRPSLLPETYSLEKVTARFEDLLLNGL